MSLYQILNFEVRRALVDFKSYRKQEKDNAGSPIRFYNWWCDLHGLWLKDFVIQRNLLPNGKILNFCSESGNRNVLYHVKEGPLVFISIENLHDDRMEYADHLMFSRYATSKSQHYREDRGNRGDVLHKPILADLSLGYDYFEESSYLRFPLWLLYMFPANADEKAIKTRCEQLRYPDWQGKDRFAALVARYDWYGTRSGILEALSRIDEVSCPGKVRHNDDTLKTQYNDDKESYLKQFYFNICPENSNSFGYVTEKVFESISAGCIPVYWGSMGNPEPGILNQDAIIKWNMGGDNSKAIELVGELYSNPKLMEDFMQQPRLVEGAEDKIMTMIRSLEEKIRGLF